MEELRDRMEKTLEKLDYFLKIQISIQEKR